MLVPHVKQGLLQGSENNKEQHSLEPNMLIGLDSIASTEARVQSEQDVRRNPLRSFNSAHAANPTQTKGMTLTRCPPKRAPEVVPQGTPNCHLKKKTITSRPGPQIQLEFHCTKHNHFLTRSHLAVMACRSSPPHCILGIYLISSVQLTKV